ncbi:Carboxyl-terminal-processing peptidase 2, partial [Durusdinium trenchii]
HDLATMPRCLGTVWMAVLVLAAASHFLAFVPLATPSRPRVARVARADGPVGLRSAEHSGELTQRKQRPVIAVLVAMMLSFSLAAAALAPPDPTVEAAWGFVRRNYYDQTFNKQDWNALHERFLRRVDQGERAESVVREMVQSLGDRYSRVIDAATFEQLMAFDPMGVGLVLARNDQKEVIISSPPFAGSSAAKAGLRQGQRVEKVDDMSFKELSLLAVADRVSTRDPPSVTLTLREGEGETREVVLERLRQAKPQNQVESGIVTNALGHKVGFLRLRTVGARSALEMQEALGRLRAEGAQEWVIDLRGNGGGSFPAALEAAELFLPKGATAAQVKLPSVDKEKPILVGEEGERQERVGSATEPVAVLVDAGSASASEVLAVALRGNCRAPLIGSRTYGKAAVQGVFGLPNKEAVALTVARYSGPHGERIEGGLEPDLSSGLSLGGLSPQGLMSALGAPLQGGGDYGLDVEGASKLALAACAESAR